MPEERQEQPPNQPAERHPVEKGVDVRRELADNADLQEAVGARPSPDPKPRPPAEPINKAADFTETTPERAVGDALSETQPEAMPAPPTPPPPSDSDKGEA